MYVVCPNKMSQACLQFFITSHYRGKAKYRIRSVGVLLFYMQRFPVNWDTSGLKYFDPIKRLPQIYESAHNVLKRF
jgi:hypothetical protein